MARPFFLLFISLHLGIIFLYNAEACLRGYLELTGAPVEAGPFGPALHCIGRLIRTNPAATYAHYAGTACGYGFFAPQVASPFYLALSFYDRDGHIFETMDEPDFQQPAGRMRYRSFLGAFRPLLPHKTSSGGTESIDCRLAKAVAVSISERQATSPQIYRIRCRVLVYRFPALRDYPALPEGRFILLYERFKAPAKLNPSNP